MSRIDFERRWPENVPGAFYVGNQCLDCVLCREVAPTVFALNRDGGYSYVKKQPETPEELVAAREAVMGCCVETIHEDGAKFDGVAIPPQPYLEYPDVTKRWWRFWK